MADEKDVPQGLSDDELADESAAEELPQREQMSLIDPTGSSLTIDHVTTMAPVVHPPAE
jgi:hypothetical protein